MNEQPLSAKKCVPCEGLEKPLGLDETQPLLERIPQWKLGEYGKKLVKEYNTKNFMAAVGLINSIARVAEAENHHPDLNLTEYRKLKVTLTTHAIGGLSENDFILAAKIDELPVELTQE